MQTIILENKKEIVSVVFGLLVLSFLSFFLITHSLYKTMNVSMMPTLLVGDHLFINTGTYQPEQGDVVVFSNPKNGKSYIRRLVGFPGDRVQMKNGALYLNGEPAKTVSTGTPSEYAEILPNGRIYTILKTKPTGLGRVDNTEEFIVPKDHYFVLGDNRIVSVDSREAGRVGFVSKENLKGKAAFIYFSTSGHLYKPWTWFSVRLNRIFTRIH